MENLIRLILSLVILSGFFVTGFMILDGDLKSVDQNTAMLIGAVLGAASSQANNVVMWWFGGSKGSADKDKTIAAAVVANTTNKGG